MLKKLRIRFVVIMMTVVSLMLAIIFGLILHFTRLNYIASSVQLMRSAAMEPIRPDRPDAPRDFTPLPYFVLFPDEDGKLQSRGADDFFDLSDSQLRQRLWNIARAQNVHHGLIREYRLRFMNVSAPGGKASTVFMDASSEMESMEGLISVCFTVGGLSLVLFLCISIFFAHLLVKPVEKAWQQQRQFVADASHELKTPLTVITTNAELLCAGQDASAQMGSAENILNVAKQMRTLVEALLELARVDNGSLQMNMESLDMSELVRERLLLFEPVCFESDLELSCAVEEPLLLKGSRQHLAQLVDILMDNAVKYSHSGSTVNVRLERQGPGCLLSVENRGESISPEDLKNIFKRFYRTDKARSSSGSYGLGLAIAESIVSGHRGKIWAESADGLNSFHVRLPM